MYGVAPVSRADEGVAVDRAEASPACSLSGPADLSHDVGMCYPAPCRDSGDPVGEPLRQRSWEAAGVGSLSAIPGWRRRPFLSVIAWPPDPLSPDALSPGDGLLASEVS